MAWLDSLWHYECLPFDSQVDPHSLWLAVGAGGHVGASVWTPGYDIVGTIIYSLRTDTGWSVPESAPPPHRNSLSGCIALDSLGQPLLLYDLFSYVMFARRRGLIWEVDTAARPRPPYETVYYSTGVGIDDEDCPWGWGEVYLTFPGDLYSGPELEVYRCTDTGWVTRGCVGGSFAGIGPVDAAVDTTGLPCWSTFWGCEGAPNEGFVYNGEVIDTLRRTDIALQIDSLNRPMIANLHGDSLLFHYREDQDWYFRLVGTLGAIEVDMVLDDIDQPIIAYSDSSGVWIAHGIDVVGTGEKQLIVRDAGRAPTICRGMLMYQPTASSSLPAAVLLDLSGREVMDLPGELASGASGAVRHHDIRHIAPGVYFVVSPSPYPSPPEGERMKERGVRSAVSGERSAVCVRKVVIQR